MKRKALTNIRHLCTYILTLQVTSPLSRRVEWVVPTKVWGGGGGGGWGGGGDGGLDSSLRMPCLPSILHAFYLRNKLNNAVPFLESIDFIVF